MADEILNAIADAIAATISAQVTDVQTLPYEPLASYGFKGPTVVVGLPDLRLPRYDEPQGQSGDNTNLGYFDWYATWPVTLYVRLESAEKSARLARLITAQIVKAFHTVPKLVGNVVEDASVLSARSGYNNADADVRLIVVEFDVETYVPLPT